MYIGIDVGGTKTLICITDEVSKNSKPKILAEKKFENSNNFDNDFTNLVNSIKTLAENSAIKGIAIALPAELDESKTAIKSAVNLNDWEGRNIKQLLSTKFNCRVELGHDGGLGGLGEFTYGAGEGMDEMYFLPWGTGIGGSIVSKLGETVRIKSPEVGWQLIKGEYLEILCGGAGIKKRFGKRAEELSEEEWNLVLDDLAQGLNNIVTVAGFNTIVVGGGIGTKQVNRLPILQELTNKKLDFQKVELIPAELGEYAAVYGCYAMLVA